MKHSKLTALIFIALIFGVVVGHFAPDFAVRMRPFAVIFLRMVKMIIAPLLFATLVVGISGHGDAKSLGKIGLKTIVYFEVVTTLALIIGLTMANLFFFKKKRGYLISPRNQCSRLLSNQLVSIEIRIPFKNITPDIAIMAAHPRPAVDVVICWFPGSMK